MLINALVVGSLATNCYLAWCPLTQEALIIDPGDEADYIVQKIQDLNLKPSAIVATHGHYDHTLAANDLRLIFKIPFYLSPKDSFLYRRTCPIAPDQMPSLIHFGQENHKIIPTPGHTPGSVCLYSANILFSGDTLFQASVGRTDLPYSSAFDLQKSLRRLSKLPPETKVLSGHGEETTIGHERF